MTYGESESVLGLAHLGGGGGGGRSCAAETTALGPTGAHLGGLPGGGAPAAGGRSPVPSFHQAENPTAPAARNFRLCLPSYEK
jgi:hypothetical protein